MISTQDDITEKMRAILIDWLIDVHAKFKLEANTLFMAANIIDRFLSKERISRKQLQLAGVAAMLIACKFEEIYAPEVRDFVYISDEVSASLRERGESLT
jgi:cyclin B